MREVEKSTGEIPMALQNKPTLSTWVRDYYVGFMMLSTSRVATMGGVGPIPLSEIVAYLELDNVTDLEERERFVMMIRALDTKFVSHMNEKAEQNRVRHKR